MAHEREFDSSLQNAFDRMHRAHKRGTGCHLTADMIAALSVTILGEIWSDDDPHDPARRALEQGGSNG